VAEEFRKIQQQRRDAVQKLESAEFREADTLLKCVIQKSKELYGPDYYWRQTSERMILRSYCERKLWDEAERQLLHIAENQMQHNLVGDFANTTHELAKLLASQKGDFARAELHCRKAIHAKTQVLGNVWDHSVYESMDLLVQIFEGRNDPVSAAGYRQILKDKMWTYERNDIEELSRMDTWRTFTVLDQERAEYFTDLLPPDDEKGKRWKQICRNIRYRSVGFCGSGYGYNLLHAAAEFGQEDTIRCLLDIERDARLILFDDFVNVKDDKGNTPLHFAAKGRLEVVRLLLSHGADPNIKSNNLKTPLIVATQAGSVDVVRVLLEHRADLAAQDEQGWAALHHAIFSNGQGEIMELLFEKGADVNSLGGFERTPLHCAAIREREDIVLLLLEKGANPNAADRAGESPLDLAKKEENHRIVQILERAS
jgi:ankyrin repeat protein